MATAALSPVRQIGRLAPENAAHNLKPATTVAEAVGNAPAILEPKMDGWRLLAHVTDDGVRMYSRNGLSYSGRLPLIEREIRDRFPAGTWLDGEAVAIEIGDGVEINHNWGLVQSVMTTSGGHPLRDKVTYVVFDMLAHGGIDARPLSFRNRRALLEQVFGAGGFDRVALSVQMPATEANHETLIALGYEGSVVKHLDAPYASGRRGRGQFKIKPQATVDAVVIGFKPGENGFAGLIGAIIFGQHDPDSGEMVERGRCSGMDYATRVWMTEHADRLIADRTVIEVAHHGPMAEGLRHPQYKRMRTDRAAATVLLHDA